MGDQALQKQVSGVQETLGKFVKKPPLLEKNLMRPPFRFLHDIFIAVLENTGFFQGLYTPEEIDSSGLNTREEKTLFLQKTLDTIAMVTGSNLSKVKVSKILAGQEPELTNTALETLAKALQSGMSSRKVVQELTGIDPGGSPGSQPGATKEKKDSKPEAGKKKEGAAGTSSKKPSKSEAESSSKRGPSPAAVDKKGSTGNLAAGNKGKQDTGAGNKKSSGSQPPVKPPAGASKAAQDKKAQEKKSEVKGQPAAKAAASTSNTKLKPNPYEKQPAKPMKAKPPAHSDSKGRRDSTDSTRGSVEQDAGSKQGQGRRGSFSKPTVASMSRSSSNQNIAEKKAEEPVNPVSSVPPVSAHAVSSNDTVTSSVNDDPQFMNEVESLLQEHGIVVEDPLPPPVERPVSRKSANSSPGLSRKPLLERKNSDPTKLTDARNSKLVSSEVEIEDLDDEYSDVDSIPQEHDLAESPVDLDPSKSRPYKSKPKSGTNNRSRHSAPRQGSGQAKGRAAERSGGRNRSGKSAAAIGKMAVAPLSSSAAKSQPTPATAPVPAKERKDSLDSGEQFDAISNRPITSRTRGPPGFPGSARPPSGAAGGGGARPVSARPAPPRPLTARQENPEPFRPPTSKIPLILESEKLDDEDDEYMIAQEKATQGLLETMGENLMSRTEDGIGGDSFGGFPDSEVKGHLVQQILDTKKELEDAPKKDGDVDGIGPGGASDQDMDKIRQATRVEMERLKTLIQNTARVSNPIGKLLDFIQEDIENMAAEFKKYKEESAQIDSKLNNFKEETRKLFVPYRKQIREVEEKLESQAAAADAGYTRILVLEERFGSILDALDAAEENDDMDFFPPEFVTHFSDQPINMAEPLSEAYLKREASRNKTYLLFGSHPWKKPSKALELPRKPKDPKNISAIKDHDFKTGMVPEEFYTKGEKRVMIKVKPKKRFRLKPTSQYYQAKPESGKKKSKKGTDGLLAPPKQLDSLEIAKIMELANAEEADLNLNGNPEAGIATMVVDVEVEENDESEKPVDVEVEAISLN